jgi:chromosome partitioning protein
MAKKIVVGIIKGGSAKTTTAINLAAALQAKGKRILLVDLDPSANATVSVGIDPTKLQHHFYHLFTQTDLPAGDVITTTTFGLDVLPSHTKLSDVVNGMKPTQIGVLRTLLASLENHYDFIVIDIMPTENSMATSAYLAADEVIVPLEAQYLPMYGLADGLRQIDEVKTGLNSQLRVAGVLYTKVQSRTNIAKAVMDHVNENYPDLVYPFHIEWSTKHADASAAGLPMVVYEPTHQGAIAYTQLAERFL